MAGSNARTKTRSKTTAQLRLPMHKGQHGGAREGAGRPCSRRTEVEHRRRERFAHARPLQVTVRLTAEAAELGRRHLHRVVRAVFVKTCKLRQFRIVHYSVMHNHVHLVAEASSRAAMTRGMRSVNIRIAKQVNRALGRPRGKVVAHRYHERSLRSPTEVRNSLRYVLNNFRRHLWKDRGERCAAGYMDPCSSSQFFDGWRGREAVAFQGPGPPVVAAKTDLLRRLWRQRGLIPVDDVPGRWHRPPRSRGGRGRP